MKNNCLKYLLFYFLIILNSFSEAQLSPALEWRKTTHSPKGLNGLAQSDEQSGEEWWYSHKNVCDSTGKHTGYVTVGYTSLVSTIATFSAAQTLYNEGPDSPYNPINSVNFDYNTLPEGCSDRDYIGEHRTPARGNIGLNDLEGNMIYCKPKTIGALEEVIQDPQNPNYFYVVGAHLGVKPYRNKINFVHYNQTATNPNDNFSITSLGTATTYTNRIAHFYVAKIDLAGNVIWEGLYGYLDYSASPLLAYETSSYGYDIIKSSNGNLIATGSAKLDNGTNSSSVPFLLEINPDNGYLVKKTTLPVGSNLVPLTNLINGYSSGGIGHSLIEIIPTGNYAIATTCYFANTSLNDNNNVFIWNLDKNFNAVTTWTNNPIRISGVGPNYYNSTIWEIKYHKALNQLLVPVVRDCNLCAHAGDNSAEGYIYRYDINGNLSANGINPSPMGEINAFDLRIGVEETSDGGFIAVSSTRPLTTDHSPATPAELGYLASCADLDFGDWDTDALIVKYKNDGATQWTKTFDVDDNRARQTPPGDLKRQECLYKITEAQDGGYVICGNSSANFDDNYMAKVYSDCYTQQTYTFGPNYEMDITANTVWNSSQNVLGKIIVHPGAVFTIAGANTKIKFADSKISGIETNLTVMDGGIVNIVDGASFSALDSVVCKKSKWDGIKAQGGLVEESSVLVYPNPANGNFNILYNGSDISEITFSVFDVLGKEMRSGKVNANFVNQINTNNFNEGVYVITLYKNKTAFEKQKIVIVK